MSHPITPAPSATSKGPGFASRSRVIAVDLDSTCLRFSAGSANTIATPLDGAADTLRAIAAAGYEIRYVTERPQIGAVPEQIRSALAGNAFPAGPVLSVSHPPGGCASSLVRSDLFIAHSTSDVASIQESEVPHIVFSNSQSAANGLRMHARNWGEVPDLITHLLGPILVPPDRWFDLCEAEKRCSEVAQQLDAVLSLLASLRSQPLPKPRSRPKAMSNETEMRLLHLDRHREQLATQLERLERKCAHLTEDVAARDAFLAAHPEYARSASERDLERETRRLRDERDALSYERSYLEHERAALEALSAQLEAQRDDFATEHAALDHERATLGLPPRTTPLIDQTCAVPTVYAAYGAYAHTVPQISILLGTTVAQPCAEHEVVRMGYQIIGRRVDVRVGKSQTDIDILAMRAGSRGEYLRRSRADILTQLEMMSADDPHRSASQRRLRALEGELFLAVEVKWMTGSLSRVQQELYENLLAGGTTTIIGELPDRGEVAGITNARAFAASALIIRIGHREWVARNEGNAIRSVRDQLHGDQGQPGVTRVFAPTQTPPTD